MANIPLKTIKFPGLDGTYTVPQVDSTLSTSGQSADAKVTGDSLKVKADIEGAVSMAKALVGGKYTLDQSPYHYRQSPDAGALDEKIVGGTLGWNRLVENGNFADSTGWSKGGGVSSFSVANNTATLNIPSGTTYNKYIGISNVPIVASHKYLVFAVMASPTITQAFIQRSSNGIINASGNKTISSADTVVAGIYSETVTGVASFYFRFSDTATTSDTTGTIKKAQIIDLTTLFGSTIADYIYSLEQSSAGAGVDWVRQYIDLDTYHEYCEPTLKSVEGLQSRDVVGFNLWDEEWENGLIESTGVTQGSRVISKNFIPVLAGETYCLSTYGTVAYRGRGLFYDSEKNPLAYYSDFPEAVTVSNDRVLGTFVVPSGACYLKFCAYATYGTTYNHDICINLSNPSRNGTYEPYEKHSYPLDSSIELRGIPKLSDGKMYFDGDEYQSDGQVVRRYGVVDFGTLNWSAVAESIFRTDGIYYNKANGLSNFVQNKYDVSTQSSYSAIEDKHIRGDVSSGRIFVRDSAYTEAATFKTVMSGVYLVYELATPTAESAQPYQSPQLAGATEEYVTSGVVPVGHESRYYEDITGKVNDLPSDFSTLIAPVEKSFTATRNYTVGSFVIVNNQLYKVTSAISSGGTITPNSNVTATTIMAEILALA